MNDRPLFWFVPCLGGVPQVLRAAGCAHVLEYAHTHTAVEGAAGLTPAGRGGTVVHNHTSERVPDGIEWHDCGMPAGIWLGWLPRRRPRPADFARARSVFVATLKLGDGQNWHVPIVRPCRQRDPQRYALPDEPHLTSGLSAELLSRADEIIDIVEHRERYDAGLDIYPYCIGLLTSIYRLGPCEIAAWGLLADRDLAGQMVMLSIDWHERVLVAAARLEPELEDEVLGVA